MTYNPVTQQIIDLLDKEQIEYELFEHEPVHTSEQAAVVREGYTLSQGAKAIVARIKRSATDRFFVVLVVPGDKKFDADRVKVLLAAKDVRFADPVELSGLTGGVESGGVPPFGKLFDLEMIVDPLLFDNEWIIFNAGDRQVSVAMRSADFQKVTQPRVESII